MGNTNSYWLSHVGAEYANKHDGNNETHPQKVSTETEEEKVPSSLSKEDLLNNLANNIQGTLNVVRNVETQGKSHVEKLKEIYKIMNKAEEELNRFILEMKNEIQRVEKCEQPQQGRQTDAIGTGKDTQKKEMTVQENNDPQGEKESVVSSSTTNIEHKEENRNEMQTEEKSKYLQQGLQTDYIQSEKETQNVERTIQENHKLQGLSKIAGQRLREDNPAITDLSDPNRPTKLGEVYSELYDNEWTDAFEELQSAGYSEEESITTLRQTLVNVIDFCGRKSEGLLKKTEEAVHNLFEDFKPTKQMNNFGHLTMPRKQMKHFGKMIREASFEEYLGADIILQQKWKPKHWKADGNMNHSNKVETPEAVKKQLKIFRKEVAESMVPLVQKAYMSASWSEQGCLSALKPYILKCLFLGWMMVVQSPPLALSTWNPGDKFNKDLYKDYTKSGLTIEYVVWPALLLQENGPLIGKGVAQGGKSTDDGDNNKDKAEETYNLNDISI